MLFLEKPQLFRSDMKVVGCFCIFEGKILLLFRNKNKTEGEMWGCPGGKVNTGENLSEAMVREIEEETGIKANISDLIFFKTVFVRYPHSNIEYSIFSLSLKNKPAVIVHEREHTSYQWILPQDALSLSLIPDEDVCIKMFFQI